MSDHQSVVPGTAEPFGVAVAVSPEPFGRAPFEVHAPEGETVAGLLKRIVDAGYPVDALERTEIYVDGRRLDRNDDADALRVLRAGETVNVVFEPLGGGGGRKDVGQILLTVAVVAVSMWLGVGPRTAAMLAMAINGSVQMIKGLFKPDQDGQAKANDRYALQSASNQYRPWAPMPLALGEVVVAPDLAAKTFSQSQGDDVWFYGILGLHYGPCEVSGLKVGDTLVSSLGPGDFRMVQHLTPGPRTFSLYPNDVDQLDFPQLKLEATQTSAEPVVRTGSSDGSRFDFDFFLPSGLYFQKDDGRVLTASVSVNIRYRPVDETGAPTGSGAWQAAPGMARSAKTKDPWRITHPVSLPHGRYEFEVTRNRPDDNNDKRHDDIYWSALKSVAFRKPLTDTTLSIIEFAVRATAINQGSLAPITCRIRPICSTWKGGAWGPAEPTSNPAAITRWLLTGPAPAKPLPLAQADTRLRAWSTLCDQYGWTANHYVNAERTQADAMGLLDQSGRASLFWDGTQVAASPWVEKPAPRQLFTGQNLRDHRWTYAYPEPVHALRVEFANIVMNGEADELYVYDDGYGPVADPAKGIAAATLVEAYRLEGQRTPGQAYKDGRWKLGERKHQRRVDTWTSDIENLTCQLGDRVRLAWRRIDGDSARVHCRRHGGGLIVGLRLSQPVFMEAGVDYAVDLRTPTGLFHAVPVVNAGGETREILFVDPRAEALSPRAGDMIAFGPSSRVSEDVEIIGIQPGEDLSAVLTGVRYVAPLLMAGETGPIPPLTSKLSGDRSADPPAPVLLGVQEDATGVRLAFSLPTWRGSPISGFTARWRAAPEAGEAAGWTPLPALDATARELLAPPLREAPSTVSGADATRVEIELVATTVAGRASPPLLVTVVKPAPAQPSPAVWSVAPKPPAADGTSQPILIVTGEVNDPNVAAVLIQWGLTAEGPWNDAYHGAPLTKALEVSGLTAGVEHYVAITHLSAQGVPSQFLVIGPRVPGSLTAGDTTNVGGRPVGQVVQSLDEVLLDVQALEIEAGEIQTSQTQLRAVMQGQGSLLKNPSFWGGVNSAGYPDGMRDWVNGLDYTIAPGRVSDKGIRFVAPADAEMGQVTEYGTAGWVSPLTGGAIVMEAVVTLESGSLEGSGLLLQGFAGATQVNGDTVSFGFAKDLTGTAGPGVPGRTYAFARLLNFHPSVDFGLLYMMANWAGMAGGLRPAKTVVFHHVSVRRATAEEIAAGEALGLDPTSLSARNASHEGALADANGKLMSWSQKRVIAGQAQAFAQMMALDENGVPTSSVRFGAGEVGLWNQIGGEDQWVEALSLQGGNARFSGNLSVASGIYLGSGTVWSVALRPQTFVLGDGETISFGGANIGVPTYEFMRDNLLPLAAGESYDLQIKNLTAAGGTVWAKISIPGTPSAQTLAGPGTAPGSGPTRQNVKTPKPDSVNGNYTITLSGTYAFTIFKNTQFQDFEGSVTVGLFVRKAGVWSRVGALTASWYTNTDNPSSVNRVEIVPWTVTDTVQMGDTIEAFGATIESFSGPLAGRSVGLLSLGPIDWSSQGSASGTKSALASGAKTSIKITPQG